LGTITFYVLHFNLLHGSASARRLRWRKRTDTESNHSRPATYRLTRLVSSMKASLSITLISLLLRSSCSSLVRRRNRPLGTLLKWFRLKLLQTKRNE